MPKMFNMDCFIFPPPGEKSHAEWKRHHYGGKPPPRPPPQNYSRFSLLLRIAPAAFPADRFRPAACRKSSAVGFAVRSGERGETPRRKVTNRGNP